MKRKPESLQRHAAFFSHLQSLLFIICLILTGLSHDGETSELRPQKPRGFIPATEGHWTFLNINCDGNVENNKTVSTELIRHHDGLLDNLLPKKKKKRKRKRKKSRNTRSASNYEETLINDLQSNSQELDGENGGSFFASKLFGDDINTKYFSDDNPKSKSINIISQRDKDPHKTSGNNTNVHGRLPLTISEGIIGDSKHIHLNVNCPEAVLYNDAINASVSHLIVSSDGTLSVANESLQTSGDLSYLKLWSLGGLKIPNSCSWMPPTVEILDLSHSILQEGNFTDCASRLKTLSIAATSLHSIHICLPSLKSLDASWNNLKVFPQECPEGTDGVEELDLSRNSLKLWSSCGWPSVSHANLIYNEITHLDLESCESPNLIDLKVSHNKLTKMPSFTPPSLLNLDLSHNEIKKMSRVEGSLQTLLLSHNELTRLGNQPFRFAWQLLTLDLSYNGLTTLYGHSFLGLRELRSLDVSFNAIQDVKHEAFRSLVRLRKLSLVGNKLTQLDPRLMAGLPKGLEFSAHDNPWRCFCHLLASLSRASRAHCGHSCHEQKLHCQEGELKIDIQDILQRCIQVVEGMSEEEKLSHAKHLEIPDSDEDVSEEVKSEDLPLMVIPGVVLIIFVPILIVLVRNIYVKRKKIREKWCSCLAPSRPEAPSHSFSPWRTNQADGVSKDSDSETDL